MKKLAFLFTFSLILFGACSNKLAQKSDGHGDKKEKITYVLIETQYGNMTAKLYNETPQHRDNFVKLVKEGFYDDLLFHRVIKNFMIQGGDPNSKTAQPGQMLGDGNLGYLIPAEFVKGLFHKKGALAAARTNNPEKASSSCQFYIVQGNVWNDQGLEMMKNRFNKEFSPEQIEAYKTIGGTPHLDDDYTVFGEVVEGLDVIDRIAAVTTGPADRPLEDVKMKISILKNYKEEKK